jgi:hypothetical protein
VSQSEGISARREGKDKAQEVKLGKTRQGIVAWAGNGL